MKAYKSLDTNFILQFSHTKPEDVALKNDDNSPTVEAIEIGFELSNAQPMLMFVFSATEEGKCPSINSIANVMRVGYQKTTDNEPLNESYGLLLDALRMIHNGKVTVGQDTIVPMQVLENGAIVYINDNICCLRIAPVTQFTV